jgi:hypothetical protein
MKYTRRSNKKQGKNTRRKRGGTIYYPPGDLRKSYYFYVREDAKIKRLTNYLDDNTITNKFTDKQVGKHKGTWITGQLTSGLIPGDLIVILYQANITSLGVKLHIVKSVDPDSDNFKYLTLGLFGNVLKTTLGTGAKKLYNLTLGNLSKLGRLYSHDNYTAACTQNELASCYDYDLKFTAGVAGDEKNGVNYRLMPFALTMTSGAVLSDKIWILREKYRTNTLKLGNIDKPAMDSVIRNYESNENSLLVFIKLFNAAKDAIGLVDGFEILKKNPMWQACFTKKLKDYIETANFNNKTLQEIQTRVKSPENEDIGMMLLLLYDYNDYKLDEYKDNVIHEILNNNKINPKHGWSFLGVKKTRDIFNSAEMELLYKYDYISPETLISRVPDWNNEYFPIKKMYRKGKEFTYSITLAQAKEFQHNYSEGPKTPLTERQKRMQKQQREQLKKEKQEQQDRQPQREREEQQPKQQQQQPKQQQQQPKQQQQQPKQEQQQPKQEQQQPKQEQQPEPTIRGADEDGWKYKHGNNIYGPFGSNQMKEWYNAKHLNDDTLITRNLGWGGYHTIKKVFSNVNPFSGIVPPEPKYPPQSSTTSSQPESDAPQSSASRSADPQVHTQDDYTEEPNVNKEYYDKLEVGTVFIRELIHNCNTHTPRCNDIGKITKMKGNLIYYDIYNETDYRCRGRDRKTYCVMDPTHKSYYGKLPKEEDPDEKNLFWFVVPQPGTEDKLRACAKIDEEVSGQNASVKKSVQEETQSVPAAVVPEPASPVAPEPVQQQPQSVPAAVVPEPVAPAAPAAPAAPTQESNGNASEIKELRDMLKDLISKITSGNSTPAIAEKLEQAAADLAAASSPVMLTTEHYKVNIVTETPDGKLIIEILPNEKSKGGSKKRKQRRQNKRSNKQSKK